MSQTADDLDFSDHFDHFFELDNMELVTPFYSTSYSGSLRPHTLVAEGIIH
jgi:hypothetical protein